jgi:peptide/nickel transport system ATP-binding protein
MAETDTLFSTPKHPYTAALLSAIPEPDPAARRRPRRVRSPGATLAEQPIRQARQRVVLQGEVANPAAPPSGCYFHPRCQYAIDLCATQKPAWEEIEPGHFVRCHRSRELALKGT